MNDTSRPKKLSPRLFIYLAGVITVLSLIHGCGENSLPPPAPPAQGIVVITGGAV